MKSATVAYERVCDQYHMHTLQLPTEREKLYLPQMRADVSFNVLERVAISRAVWPHATENGAHLFPVFCVRVCLCLCVCVCVSFPIQLRRVVSVVVNR